MKYCTICGKEIINGFNGCMMYDTCFDCKPIKYYCKPKKAEITGDFEKLILIKQENNFE